MEKQELLPCPFCGGKATLRQYRADGLEIKCEDCRSGRQQRWLHKGRDWLAAKMVDKWNERIELRDKCQGHGREVCAMCCWPPRKVCDCNQGRLPCNCK